MSTRRSSGSGTGKPPADPIETCVGQRMSKGDLRIAGKTDMDTGTSPGFTIFKSNGSAGSLPKIAEGSDSSVN